MVLEHDLGLWGLGLHDDWRDFRVLVGDRAVVLDVLVADGAVAPVCLRDGELVSQVVLGLPLLGDWAYRCGRDVEPELVLNLVDLEHRPGSILLRAGVDYPPDEAKTSLGIAIVGAIDPNGLCDGLTALDLNVDDRNGAVDLDLEELVLDDETEIPLTENQEVLLLPRAILPALEYPELVEIKGELFSVCSIEAQGGIGLNLQVL